MKKNILVQVGTRREIRSRVVPIDTKDGETVGERIEQYEVDVPIMEAQNVEMTAEEEAEMLSISEEIEAEPSIEEQLADLTDLVSAMLEVM